MERHDPDAVEGLVLLSHQPIVRVRDGQLFAESRHPLAQLATLYSDRIVINGEEHVVKRT